MPKSTNTVNVNRVTFKLKMLRPTVWVFVGSGIFFSCNKKIPELFVTALFYEKPSLVLRIVSLTADAPVSVAISPPLS